MKKPSIYKIYRNRMVHGLFIGSQMDLDIELLKLNKMSTIEKNRLGWEFTAKYDAKRTRKAQMAMG